MRGKTQKAMKKGKCRNVILVYGNEPDSLHAKMYPYPLTPEAIEEIYNFTRGRTDRGWRIVRLFLAGERGLLTLVFKPYEDAKKQEKLRGESAENQKREGGETVGR